MTDATGNPDDALELGLWYRGNLLRVAGQLLVYADVRKGRALILWRF
ncbi:MAG: hypothetical protein ACK4GO_16810 [Gemmobacter sp.]